MVAKSVVWERLQFPCFINDLPLQLDFYISDEVDQVLLSCQALKTSKCILFFENNIVRISYRDIQLFTRPSRANVCCVCA